MTGRVIACWSIATAAVGTWVRCTATAATGRGIAAAAVAVSTTSSVSAGAVLAH